MGVLRAHRRASGSGGTGPARQLSGGAVVLMGLGLTAALGCGSLPIPTTAVEGSTITLMVPQAYPTGFGRALAGSPPADPDSGPWPGYDQGAGPEDPQRGEVLFELVDNQGASFSPRKFFPVRYLTRVFPHTGSEGSITQSSLSGTYASGQAIAILDVPEVSSTGSYQIKLLRYRRKEQPDHDEFEKWPASPGEVQTSLGDDWFGWGQDNGPDGSPDPIPIDILDSSATNTPKRGWTDLAGGGTGIASSDVTEELDTLIPHPELIVTAKPMSPPGPPPAAWEVDISYPRRIVRIESVTSKNTTAGSAMVTWSADQTAIVDCMAADDTLRVQVLDPDQTTASVRVSFSLENYAESCGERAELGDFQQQPGTFRAFDVNGADATSGWEILPSYTPGTFN